MIRSISLMTALAFALLAVPSPKVNSLPMPTCNPNCPWVK